MPSPYWIPVIRGMARELGLHGHWLSSQSTRGPDRQRRPSGSQPWPACGGHQFGQWAGQLATDGPSCWRAVHAWRLQEVQLTKALVAHLFPHGRRTRGVAQLDTQYLCSEAMNGLGIPTTRALCVLSSDIKSAVSRSRRQPCVHRAKTS
jgi:uncharacterized protein YdiU (UPF0061 family)